MEFLTKPIDDQALVNAIQQAVERDRIVQPERRDHESELETAARIQQGLMMTEGVTEAENPAGEFFGAQRLETSAALRLSPKGIIEAVRLFCADRPFSDDCTVV